MTIDDLRFTAVLRKGAPAVLLRFLKLIGVYSMIAASCSAVVITSREPPSLLSASLFLPATACVVYGFLSSLGTIRGMNYESRRLRRFAYVAGSTALAFITWTSLQEYFGYKLYATTLHATTFNYPDREARHQLLGLLPYGQILASAAERNRIDGLLLAAIVESESDFAPEAVSPQGAVGLMQLLPSVNGKGYDANELLDPATNLDAGSKYLSFLLARFQGNPKLAVAAYIAGPKAVERYGGLPPYRETRDRVARVLAAYTRNNRCAGDARCLASLQLSLDSSLNGGRGKQH